MVHAKGAHSPDCCCADCGVRPRGDAKRCCYCVCDELCVTISLDDEPSPCDANCGCDATADCPCFYGRGILSWDADNCHWTGIIPCQSVSVTMTVELFRCDDTCYVCVSSQCLGMDGGCDQTSDCYALDDCGEYGHDCDVMGGFTVNFSKDFSSCSANCGTADVTIVCSSFINPNYSTTENYEICKDCDCVCDCLCITYTEGSCWLTKKACWDDANNRWQVDFDDNDCGWAAQTVTIELVADGNCCKWKLTTTRGTVDDPEQASDCPHPTTSWTLDDISASVDIQCSTCDTCEVEQCCPRLPTTLYARICTPCGSWCTPIELYGQTSTSAVWRSTTDITIKVTDGTFFTCHDLDITVEFECVSSGTLWNINVYCGGTLMGSATGLSVDCVPFCASGTPSIQGNEVACNYQGPTFYVDDATICMSEEACP